MRLSIIGGGGARMPAFVHALLAAGDPAFEEISLLEPDPLRRVTTCRLAVELAGALGRDGAVRVSEDPSEALRGADVVFSAIRVGGDEGRVIDEVVAFEHGVVGQETVGAGGCAMALRTIPVVLEHCRTIESVAPRALLVNFTNPAGIITEAILSHSAVRALGVCDTPSAAIEALAAFLGAGAGAGAAGAGGAGEPGAGEERAAAVAYSYAGLNHLGWVTSFRVGGEERIGELLDRFEELQRVEHAFAGLDASLVRRAGVIPTEYVFYYEDPVRYIESVRRAGATRGSDVARLNAELLGALAEAFAGGRAGGGARAAGGGSNAAARLAGAWASYSRLMAVRSDTYLRTDTEGESGAATARRRRDAEETAPLGTRAIGGYEGVALDAVAGLSGRRPGEVILNTINGAALPFLGERDVVEVPCLVHAGGVEPLVPERLPLHAEGLVEQVKAYERALVDAAVAGDAELAAAALAINPLVPGITVARRLITEYRRRHGPSLEYLS